MRRFLTGLPLALALLQGCSSVSVDRVEPVSGPVQAPQIIYVQDFDTPPAAFRIDRNARGAGKLRSRLAESLMLATAERMKKRFGSAEALPRNAALPPGRGWLVTGEFVRVNQGSRAMRTVVGFGLGGTKLETEVVVYEFGPWKPRPILRFRTTGGTNAQPGVVVGLAAPNLWLLSLDTIAHLGPGLSVDVIRTSRQIVAVLSEYMAQKGFLPPEKVYRAKKLGKWP